MSRENKEKEILPSDDQVVAEASFAERSNTACDHEWADVPSDPRSGMRSQACSKCWAGRSLAGVSFDDEQAA